MSDALKLDSKKNSGEAVSQQSSQFAFDFGYLGYAAVSQEEEKKNRRHKRILASAQHAATLDLFHSGQDPLSIPAPTKKSSREVHSDADGATLRSTSILSHEKSIDSTPGIAVTNTPSELKKKVLDLPKNSVRGAREYQAQVERQRQEEADKPVVGLMRTIHTVDRKLTRKALPTELRVENIQPSAAAKEFNPWADMIRARVKAESDPEPLPNASEEAEASNTVKSAFRPR